MLKPISLTEPIVCSSAGCRDYPGRVILTRQGPAFGYCGPHGFLIQDAVIAAGYTPYKHASSRDDIAALIAAGPPVPKVVEPPKQLTADEARVADIVALGVKTAKLNRDLSDELLRWVQVFEKLTLELGLRLAEPESMASQALALVRTMLADRFRERQELLDSFQRVQDLEAKVRFLEQSLEALRAAG